MGWIGAQRPEVVSAGPCFDPTLVSELECLVGDTDSNGSCLIQIDTGAAFRPKGTCSSSEFIIIVSADEGHHSP
ncbi:MAG: hypothetical protein AUK47_13625 [Deltaproteobacteria bacterium CG2_30_63_29]|nr:MAG: hypothetical protein AUK47_13625 [Deltaproteobacteria bacterium CG2_30_63_29]